MLKPEGMSEEVWETVKELAKEMADEMAEQAVREMLAIYESEINRLTERRKELAELMGKTILENTPIDPDRKN